MRPQIALTTDALIFSEQNNRLWILLVKRKNNPYRGQLALPGGFLEAEETLEAGCRRELFEETGIEVDTLTQVGIYDQVDRDPRGRMISVAFTTILDHPVEVKAGDDAAEAKWVPLPKARNLAFDHEEILKDAVQFLED